MNGEQAADERTAINHMTGHTKQHPGYVTKLLTQRQCQVKPEIKKPN